MKAAMPLAVARRLETKAMQRQRVDRATRAARLDSKGGVAVAKKQEVPEVIARVGSTFRPTAILTTQPASELYLSLIHI